jgi:hypothetical protein
MNRHEARSIAREFRRLYKQVDDLDRRMSATVLAGKVAEIDGDRVRLELLPADPRTGAAFLSPWVQVQEAAGATGTHFPVAVGDPMRLVSPNGELGPQSLAIRDGYTAAHPNPTGQKQQQLVIAHGGVEIRLGGGGLQLVADRIETVSAALTHNQVEIGETHRHTGVVAGVDLTGQPEG